MSLNPQESTGQQTGPEPVPPDLGERALGKLQAVLKGNGIDPGKVTLKSCEGYILDFNAWQIFRVTATTSEKQVKGKQPGTALTSEAELRRRVEEDGKKATRNPRVQQAAADILKKRRDLGFAGGKQAMQLASATTQYVVHTKCTACQGTGASACPVCRGSGKVTCTKCRGRRETMCPLCRGTKFQMAGGNRIQCSRCRGRGLVGCNICQKTGRMKCLRCKGAARTPCQNCNASGWQSLLSTLTFRAESHFDYDRAAVPDTAAAQMDALQGALVTGGHAEVSFLEDPARLASLEHLPGDTEFIVPYRVRLPYAEVAFDLKGKTISGRLFGFGPLLLDLPPVIERAAATPLKSLAEAGATQSGDIASLLTQGMRARIVGETLTGIAAGTQARTLKKLQARYPFGVREETLRAMVRQAHRALANITVRPRAIGLGIGFAASAALFALYYIGPVHAALVSKVETDAGLNILDALLLVGAGALTVLSARIMAWRTLKTVLGALKNADEKKLMPKAGASLIYGSIGTLLVYLVIVQAAVLTGHMPPAWHETIRRALGL